MIDPSILLESVSKQYVKYVDTPLLVGSLLRFRNRTRRERLQALDGIDLRVEPGEFVGVIGRNGSGKTTLLRLLAGVSAPTSGRITVRGRVAPLIAVGVGFHPELTGRENVFINGSILGLRRAEVAARLDEIIEFAELHDFIDTPVKFYSSGMFVRLGFAASVLAEPDVLLVDEVLAVGDIGFQTKCFQRMDDLRVRGATVVIVSHNLPAIQRLCERTVLLHDGTVRHDGNTADALSLYQDLSHVEVGGGNDEASPAVLESFSLLDRSGKRVRRVTYDSEVTPTMVVRTNEAIDRATVNVRIESDSGLLVYSENSPFDGVDRSFTAGERFTCTARFRARLPQGGYVVRMVLANPRGESLCAVAGPVGLFVEGRPRVRGMADLESRIQFGVPDDVPPASSDAGM